VSIGSIFSLPLPPSDSAVAVCDVSVSLFIPIPPHRAALEIHFLATAAIATTGRERSYRPREAIAMFKLGKSHTMMRPSRAAVEMEFLFTMAMLVMALS
jgi:hypothetical protein